MQVKSCGCHLFKVKLPAICIYIYVRVGLTRANLHEPYPPIIMTLSLLFPLCPGSKRGGRLVSDADRDGAVVPGGPQGQDGGDSGGHTGTLRQLGLGQQLHAPLQRHGPGLETVPARGRRRGECCLSAEELRSLSAARRYYCCSSLFGSITLGFSRGAVQTKSEHSERCVQSLENIEKSCPPRDVMVSQQVPCFLQSR